MSKKVWVGILLGLCAAGGFLWADGYALLGTYAGTAFFISVDGSGSVAAPVTIDSAGNSHIANGSYGIGIGDFDNDGLDDYLIGGVGTSNAATIEFHKRLDSGADYADGVAIEGAAGWSTYVMDFAVADYDHDGNLDFAVSDYQDGNVAVYSGHGDGTFTRVANITAPFRTIGLDSADFNNDGNPDIVVNRYGDPTGSYSYYYSQCYYYSQYGYYCNYYYTYYSTSAGFDILLGDGHGNFTQDVQYASYAYSSPSTSGYGNSWGVAAGDFDGDGKADLVRSEYNVLSQSGNSLLFFRGHGDGTFDSEPIRTGYLPGENYSLDALATADVNHDGFLDLVAADQIYNSTRVFLGHGNGTFTLQSSESVATSSFLSGIATPPTGAVDRTPPDVTLGALPSLTKQVSLVVQGSATDRGGVAQVEVLDNGTSVASVVPGAGGVVSVTISLAEGTNAIALRATDRAGNAATTPAQSVVLDTHAPQLALATLPQFATADAFTLSGTASDENGIEAVSAVVNGAVTGASIDAAGNITAAITLVPGTNSLVLQATDRAGNTSTASGQVILDTVGPAVTVTALPPFTNQPVQTIHGSATDTYGVTSVVLTINGAQVGAPVTPGSDGSFSFQTTLAEGPSSINVQASNVAGLSGNAQAATIVDTIAPTATLAALPEYTNVPALAVAGTTADVGSGVVSATFRVLGGASTGALTPAADGSVSGQLALAEGPQTILLEVRDRAGNVGATSAQVTLDTIAPAVAIASPTANQPFGTTLVPVNASVTDASPTTVSFGNLVLHLDAGGGVAAGNIDLSTEGWATIPVTARDAAGNESTANVRVVVDLSAPVADLSLAGVAGAAAIGPQPGNQLLYTLHCDDLTSVTTTESWDSSFSYAFPDGGGVLQGVAPLVEGTNLIAFHLADEVGHETITSQTVTYDVTAPSAAFTGVLATAGTPVRGTIELAATASDNLTGVASAIFVIDGANTIASRTDTVFTATVDTTTLTDGPHTVAATFADGVGNQTTITSTFVSDNTAPVVTVTSPTAGAYLRQTISVSAAAQDATSGIAGIDVTVNGAAVAHCAASPCTATFDTTSLANGPFAVGASASDRAGNSAAAAQVSAVAVNTAPSKFLISPLPGATVAGSVVLSVNVTDSYFASVECFEDGVSLGVSSAPQFSRTISVLDKIDGQVAFSCSARDLAGNVGTESATVTVHNWTIQVQPQTVALKSNGNDVQVEIDGPNVALLMPIGSRPLAIAVPGGSPIPVAAKPGGYQLGTVVVNGVTEQSLQLKFDRGALIAALKAGIASGSIPNTSAVVVRLLSGNYEIDRDTIRVQP